ncbi:FAD-dependent oxidoreductase [Mycetocola zhadangensis]|uniref:FAD-dependent oxidoreductase n=1 Tax=Mycetocola zhadangensis TaxID=1164595 RepID=A0A3L7J6Q7_9MICO|nr:FAD-dependent oxidoreductase [Mycetocola zhadangensis]RLQ86149.1 FAD-dependent oxidoreductase [Mycetocola zhadangensis]GGE88808.1 FAD-dependent oxidoreductase [Mycetocola zhadangensis]
MTTPSVPQGPSLWLDRPNRIETDPWRDGLSADVVVLGAGLTGLATALTLLEQGSSVVVLEARYIGAVSTGHTTGKVSLLQGSQLSSLDKTVPRELLEAYVSANRAGQEWIRAFAETEGVTIEVRDAITYAATDEGAPTIEAELETASSLGLGVTALSSLELPVDITGAVCLPGQFQLDAVELLAALAAAVRRNGGIIIEGVRGLDVHSSSPCVVETERGDVRGDRVVLATGMPFLKRGAQFATIQAHRSYALAYRWDQPALSGMYLSVDSPSRSVRDSEQPDGRYLVVGGNDHRVGTGQPTAARVADLADWTAGTFGALTETHSWSAQDYRVSDGLPHFGPISPGDDHVFVATGYNKWGMANAAAAGISLAGQFADTAPGWATALRGRVPTGSAIRTTLAAGATVAGDLAKGWVGAELSSLPEDGPAEGEGVVVRDGVKPVAVCRVDGVVSRTSAVCPHLGGIVAWNDVERSWDCPLHGSRFSATGDVLEGPSVTGLRN